MGSSDVLAPDLKSILSLIRFRNLVIGSATVLTGSYVTIQVPWNNDLILNVILQMISVSCFMAAGNILNDIMDIEIDRISHPLRSLPSKKVSIKQAWYLVIIFSIISILSASYGVYILNKIGLEWIPLAIIWIVSFTLMISYEIGPKTKKYGYLGNLIIGGMLGLVIIYGGASVGKYNYSVTLCIALMATFIGISREIIKDVHDLEGDLKWGRRTFPILIGVHNSRKLAYIFALLGVISIMLPFIMNWGNLEYWMIMFQGPTMYVLLCLNGPMSTGNDKKAIKSLLISMVLGLIGFFLLNILLPYIN
ncbi:MAG: hypothetical protein CMB48_07300 [Euryarchaeota archaeon]|nr:hypothetical protein [Euryarchaeota archaeon]